MTLEKNKKLANKSKINLFYVFLVDKELSDSKKKENMFDKYFPQPSNLKYNVISPSSIIGNDMNIIPEEDEKSIYNITGKKNFDFNQSSTADECSSSQNKLHHCC